MTDSDCIAFLQEVLPRLGLHWPGYRKVRKLVCKRLGRRLRETGVAGLEAYRTYLENHPEEWPVLEEFCHIPISCFYRDRGVFEQLEREVLPELAARVLPRPGEELSCWSACCASGEEPYTLAILWRTRFAHRFPRLKLRIVATDVDAHLIERAQIGCYAASGLKALPAELLDAAFLRCDMQFCVRDEFRGIAFLQQDIRETMPDEDFDLILCRNAVLTYFAPALQREIMERIAAHLRAGGALVVGIHESLPRELAGLTPWPGVRAVYRKLDPASMTPRCSAQN